MSRKELLPADICAVIDSREQLPYNLDPLKTIRGTLPTGDMTVLGLERQVIIERKSLEDLLGCLTTGRERFERELARLRAFPSRLVIVEASQADLEKGEGRLEIKDHYCERYRIHNWMAGEGNPIPLWRQSQ